MHLAPKYLLRSGSLIRRWVPAALISAVLFCGALASSPVLHHLIHPDADNDHHECAITMFSHGQVDVTDGNPVVAAPILAEPLSVDFFESAVLVSCDYVHLPGRAPPHPAS